MDRKGKLEEFFRTIVEASPLAIFDLDREGRVNNVWNQAAEEIFGWKREEVIGEKLPIVPEERRDQFRKLKQRVLEGEAFSGVEVRRRRKDGRMIEVSISTAPLRDESGGVVGIMALVADISQKKKIGAYLRRSEEKFREIFHNANDAMYLHKLTEDGLPGEFTEVNEVACSMLGYSKEEFMSMSPMDIDAGEKVTDVPAVMKDLRSESHVTFEMVHQAKDGTEVPVEISSHLFELEGEERVLSIARDITSRKRAERELKKRKQRLEDAMGAGSLAWWEMFLPSGKVEFSDLKAEILGYPPHWFEHYTDFTDLLHPEDHDKAVAAMRDHLEGRKEKYEVEYRIEKADGEYKWFRDVGSITEGSRESEQKRVTGVVIDIDARKQLEEKLKRERVQLRELHDAVDRFQACESEEELCNAAVEVTRTVLKFDRCVFYCLEEDLLVPVSSSRPEGEEELVPHEVGEGLVGKCFEKGQTIWGGDLGESERAVSIKEDLRAHMSVPIGKLGVFQAASYQEGAFSETDVDLAEILAGHLREEVKRIRLEVELRNQAIRDPLTGLYNRRYLNESLRNEVERSARYGHSLAFLMLDVNRFKEINDRYSHLTGDQVLTEVADLLRENIRSADTVARYGGDEFLIMMPETDGEAKNTVQRLREELYQWNRESDLLDFPLTLAIGISHWDPGQGRDVEKALKEADEKMYEDKRSGPYSS